MKFLSLVAVACFGVAGSLQAQSFAADAVPSSTPVSRPAAASVAEPSGRTPEKPIHAKVQNGVLTIDGMVAKVHLNYDIKGAGYLYFYLPGTGTAIVSLSKMPGATFAKTAFRGPTLSFTADKHLFELTTDGKDFDEALTRDGVWVRFDATTASLGAYPMMGFGNVLEAPYQWPVAHAASRLAAAEEQSVIPPPVPVNLLPKMAAVKPVVKPIDQH